MIGEELWKALCKKVTLKIRIISPPAGHKPTAPWRYVITQTLGHGKVLTCICWVKRSLFQAWSELVTFSFYIYRLIPLKPLSLKLWQDSFNHKIEQKYFTFLTNCQKSYIKTKCYIEISPAKLNTCPMKISTCTSNVNCCWTDGNVLIRHSHMGNLQYQQPFQKHFHHM